MYSYPLLTQILADAQEVKATKKSVPSDMKDWIMRLKAFVEENATIPINIKVEYPASPDKDQVGAILEVRAKEKGQSADKEEGESSPIYWYFLKEGSDYFLTVTDDEEEKGSPYDMEGAEKEKARRQETIFNEDVARKALIKGGYMLKALPPFKKLLPEFLESIKKAKPSDELYYEGLKNSAVGLRKDTLRLINQIKDPEIHEAMLKIKESWGPSALMDALRLAVTEQTDYRYKNDPKRFIPVETVQLSKQVQVPVYEHLNDIDDIKKWDDRIWSEKWLQRLPEGDRKKLQEALPRNVKVDFSTGKTFKIYPNKFETANVYLDKVELLHKAEQAVKSKVATPELQDLIVERLNTYVEDRAKSEEEYMCSEEGMDSAEFYDDNLKSALENCNDRINEACDKLKEGGLDEDIILDMLKEHSTETFTEDHHYEDNEIGRDSRDGEEELYMEDAELSEEEAKDLPSDQVDELLNMLDEEHLKELEYGVKGTRGERKFETIYINPGYRAMVWVVNENEFLRAVRRMQKDVKMFQKQGAPKDEIRTMLLARIKSKDYSTVARLLSSRNGTSESSS